MLACGTGTHCLPPLPVQHLTGCVHACPAAVASSYHFAELMCCKAHLCLYRAAESAVESTPDSKEGLPLPTIKIDNHSDPYATILKVDFGDKLGELLDTVRITRTDDLPVNLHQLECARRMQCTQSWCALPCCMYPSDAPRFGVRGCCQYYAPATDCTCADPSAEKLGVQHHAGEAVRGQQEQVLHHLRLDRREGTLRFVLPCRSGSWSWPSGRRSRAIRRRAT
jgi:hypothetical protein